MIGHIDLDAFFARCEELRNPELEGSPVVICVYTRGGDSGAVSTSNYEARELGIQSAMPLSQAREIADDETVFLPVDHEYYREKSREVMSVLRSQTSEVEEYSIDESFFRVRNSPETKARKIKADIEALGLSSSIGIGPNKFVAKMASEHDKPDGLKIVTDDEKKEFLADKPVEKIHGVGGKTRDKLEDIGVEKCEDLRQADNSLLVEKFGRNKAASLKSKSIGEGSKDLDSEERKQMSRIKTMNSNSSSYRYVRTELRKACESLHDRLERKNIAFSNASIIVIDAGLKTHTRSKKLKTSESFDQLFQAADSLLADFMSRDIEVRRIGARVSGLVDTERQKSLEAF